MIARVRTHIGWVAAGALAAALVIVPRAEAKVWFGGLAGDRIRWDQRITTTIAGCSTSEDCGAYVDGTEVFLRRGLSRGPADAGPPQHALGRIDREGRLTFRTPKVHAGRFHLVARVRVGSAHQWSTVSDTFRVLAAPTPRPQLVGCSSHSSAGFPDALTSPRNVIEGPLVLVGAASKHADAIRRFGGDKLPVLVAPGHRVTVEVARDARSRASLFFQPGGGVLTELGVPDGRAAVTFAACLPGARANSRAGSQPVTFWMGFLLVDAPMCLPLRIWVDGASWPRTRMLRIGVAHCD